jgi:hypothetical protein
LTFDRQGSLRLAETIFLLRPAIGRLGSVNLTEIGRRSDVQSAGAVPFERGLERVASFRPLGALLAIEVPRSAAR